MKEIPYRPHKHVNQILEILLSEVKQVLNGQFVGMYLFGSLANGGFDDFSDVDILIVTRDQMSEFVFGALNVMHERIAGLDSPWATQLEVSYIPQRALRVFNASNATHPHLDRGVGEKLHLMFHANDWIIQRQMMRERGIIIEGPRLRSLIEPISADDLRWAVIDVLPYWTTPLLKDPAREMKRRGYQSFIVLSLCRMLYTLQHGAVLSKVEAAGWAIPSLAEVWSRLIERAVDGRQNPNLEVDPQDLNATLEFIHFTIKECRRFERVNSNPTRYTDINEILKLLVSSVKGILGSQFVGMYLYGSLSSGDFNPRSSDLDFAVVTETDLPDETISALHRMHQRVWQSDSKWASKLEGAYLPRNLIRRHDPNGRSCPTVNEGKFYVGRLGSDWIIQRHILREQGLIVEGPDPNTLIDFVSEGEIRQSVSGVLHEWWLPMLEDPSWLRDRGSEYHAFTIISMCRALHALKHGTIVSKPGAIRWARDELGEQWRGTIETAVEAQSADGKNYELYESALEMIRFASNGVRSSRWG